jgi:hypothetical protein
VSSSHGEAADETVGNGKEGAEGHGAVVLGMAICVLQPGQHGLQGIGNKKAVVQHKG